MLNNYFVKEIKIKICLIKVTVPGGGGGGGLPYETDGDARRLA